MTARIVGHRASVEFEVVGVPQPQGNKTAFHRNGRTVVVEGRRPEARAAFSDWREAIAREAREAAELWGGTIDEPVTVTIDFRFPPTKSDPYRTAHVSRPDLDKLARAVLDAVTIAGLIRDDSLVWNLHVAKTYAHGVHAGAWVGVQPDGAEERDSRARLKDRAAAARRAPAGQLHLAVVDG